MAPSRAMHGKGSPEEGPLPGWAYVTRADEPLWRRTYATRADELLWRRAYATRADEPLWRRLVGETVFGIASTLFGKRKEPPPQGDDPEQYPK